MSGTKGAEKVDKQQIWRSTVDPDGGKVCIERTRGAMKSQGNSNKKMSLPYLMKPPWKKQKDKT